MRRILVESRMLVCAILLLASCTEEITLEIENEESALIVEALLTDELVHHSVTLSRSTHLNENHPNPEINAQVKIVNEFGNTYEFNEINPGEYISKTKFKAEKGVAYHLEINTQSGETIRSDSETFTFKSEINEIQVKKEADLNGLEYFNIYVNGSDASNGSKYFRYTYEETYKIIAPYWSPYELEVLPSRFVRLVDKGHFEGRVCYQTEKSNEILQIETTDLSENKISDFLINSLEISNPKVAHRYSILVKQHSQSSEAFNYFKTLEKLSTSESIFSNSQPGFLQGNLYAEDRRKKVIGYFEVVSVTSKRFFFNYSDYFLTNYSDYFDECSISAPLVHDNGDFPLASDLENLDKIFFDYTGAFLAYDRSGIYDSDILQGPYVIVDRGCGDCRVYGSSVKPSFWVD